MSTHTVALVGATGGAGTTRLALEFAATLTRTGRDVAVLDAGFATQGLGDYLDGRLDPDMTAVVAGDADFDDALVEVPVETPGDLACCPADAPFERLARAKTAGAAERLENNVAAAALSHDVVIVDTPPVAANQAIAAVDATERSVIVTPDTTRGADALAAVRGRLADIGAGVDAVIGNFADDEPAVMEADARVPAADTTDPAACPTAVPPDETFAPAVADATAAALGVDLALEFPEGSPINGLL
jgi:septum site-determining protein MinD